MDRWTGLLLVAAVLATMIPPQGVTAEHKSFEVDVKEQMATRPTYIDGSVLKLLPKKLFKSVVTGRVRDASVSEPLIIADTLVSEDVDSSPSPRVSALEVQGKVKLSQQQKEAIDRSVVVEATKRARVKIERDQEEMKQEMLERIENETKQRSLLQEAEKIQAHVTAEASKPKIDYRRLGEGRDESRLSTEEREQARLEELTALVPRLRIACRLSRPCLHGAMPLPLAATCVPHSICGTA